METKKRLRIGYGHEPVLVLWKSKQFMKMNNVEIADVERVVGKGLNGEGEWEVVDDGSRLVKAVKSLVMLAIEES